MVCPVLEMSKSFPQFLWLLNLPVQCSVLACVVWPVLGMSKSFPPFLWFLYLPVQCSVMVCMVCPVLGMSKTLPQFLWFLTPPLMCSLVAFQDKEEAAPAEAKKEDKAEGTETTAKGGEAVSYTHLTLPTILSV